MQNTPITASTPRNTMMMSPGMRSPNAEIATAAAMKNTANAPTRHMPMALRGPEISGLG